jgi:hypothetical protein
MQRLVILLFLVGQASSAGGNPLFTSNETLELLIEAPMYTLLRQAERNPELDASLTFTDSEGVDVTIEVEITTRGHSRLQMCSFPPLSISFKKKYTKSTIFAGQKKLKIVSPCKGASKFLGYFHQEYGIYKAYNLITDYSFRVRMLEITFKDTEQERRDEVIPAFFIESDREVAERLNKKEIKTQKILPSQFDVEETNKFEMFQYMIGNTDWAILKGPGDDDCCHNAKVIGADGSEKNWIVLPYDFDVSGIINTDYAMPAEGLPISSVKQRLYRGRCVHNKQLQTTIALFNEKRGELGAALAPPELRDRSRKKVLKYLDGFYEIVNDPDELNKKVIEKCRGYKPSD